MGVGKEDVLAAGPESARIVLVRGVRSELMSTDTPDVEDYGERALPELLRERWAIRSTVSTAGGTYVVLARSRVADDGSVARKGRAVPGRASEEPPSSRTAGLG
jgi:hypothetical protein